MLNLSRNTFPVAFKLYEGKTEIIDEHGNKTGSYTLNYGELQTDYLSVSPNKGTAEVDMFGSFDDYDRTLTTSNVDCQINEDSVLWIDGQDTNGPHNYIVKKRAPWKNSISYAIKKVEVSG